MIKYFLNPKILLLIAALTIRGFAEKTSAMNIDKPCEKLTKSYNFLKINQQNSVAQQKFFNDFPKDFDTFILIFGYKTSKEINTYGCLYEKSFDYINSFFRLNRVERIKFYRAIEDLSRNYNWQSDGANIFHHQVVDMIYKDDTSFLNYLNRQDSIKTESFMRFLLSAKFETKNLTVFFHKNEHKYARLSKSFFKIKNVIQ